MKKSNKIVYLIGLLCFLFAIITSVSTGIIVSSRDINGVSTVTVTFDYDNEQPKTFIHVRLGTKIQKPDNPTRKGFGFKGWFQDNNLWKFDDFFVYSDLTLRAGWDYFQYSITYNSNGGDMPSDTQYYYNIDSEIVLKNPSKENSIFLGWFNNEGRKISKINKGSIGDLTLNAKWVDNATVTSTNTLKGNVEYYVKEDDYTKIVVNSIPIDNKFHLFKYWVDDVDNIVSEDEKTEISTDFFETSNLRAVYMSDEEEYKWNKDNGVIPIFINNEHTLVRYGMYPQDNINEKAITNRLNQMSCPSFGDYYHYRGSYYYKVVSTLYGGGSLPYKMFKNGDEIINGETYWFRVQPIVWKIINSGENKVTLLSNVITEPIKYFTSYDIKEMDDGKIYPNNYYYSNLREWLNNYFYEYSFIFNQDYLIDTILQNDSETAMDTTEEFCSPPTNDKVFALSYLEYNTGYFTISDYQKRKIVGSDLFIACGGLYSTGDSDLLCSYIWTRSPSGTNGYSVAKVNRAGGLNASDGYSDYCGIQPAITLNITDII